MNRFKYVLLGCLLLLTACQSDPQEGPMPPSPAGGFAFSLLCDGFEQGSTRSEQPSRAGYDKVAFSVIDAEEFAVDGLKGVYDPATSVLRLEGLREGDYRLLLTASPSTPCARSATSGSPSRKISAARCRPNISIRRPPSRW